MLDKIGVFCSGFIFLQDVDKSTLSIDNSGIFCYNDGIRYSGSLCGCPESFFLFIPEKNVEKGVYLWQKQ